MLNLPQTYIIFACNSGIAIETIKQLLPHIKRLILVYHENKEQIEEFLSTYKKYTTLIEFIKADITNLEKLSYAFSKIEIKESFAAVNFSALRSYDFKPLYETDSSITENIINVNLIGAINFLKTVIKFSRQVKKSRIVLLGSNVSKSGLKNGSVYAASKAAIANLVKSVSMEEGENGTLINVISPGPVILKNQIFSDEYQRFRDSYFNEKKERTALKKLAIPEDISSLILYLTSLNNNHITGEEIFITGGES